jgi:hypothetical protein
MRNTLGDLNNYLFEQMERITDESLSGEDLERELRRTDAVTGIAETVIKNSRLALDAIEAVQEYGLGLEKNFALPAMLEAGSK